MSRFWFGFLAFTGLSILAVVCGALYLNERLQELPAELQARLGESNVTLGFSEHSVSWRQQALRLENVVVSSNGSSLKFEAQRCTAGLLSLLKAKAELRCEPGFVAQGLKTRVRGDLWILINGFKSTELVSFEATLITPDLVAAPARLNISAIGTLVPAGENKISGKVSVKDLDVALGSLLEKPYESLRSIPLVRDQIGDTPRNVKIASLTGEYQLLGKNGTAKAVDLKSDRFNIQSDQLTLTDNQLLGTLRFFPDLRGLAPALVETLKAGEAQFFVPLLVAGNLEEPDISIEEGWVQKRLQTVLQRGVTEETKQYLTHEYETKWKGKIEDFLKKALGK